MIDDFKENAQPASSSRAAEIIATSGQAPIQNLGGFAQFLGGTAFSSTSTLATSDIDSAVSNATQLALVLKRLSKRDPITKLKALEEFESYLKSKERNENELTGILNLWTKLFVKLGIDVDQILPVWIISLFDQNKDVARVANESFQATFPPEKRVDVLVFGREKILSYITDIILYKTSETLSDPRFTSKEDMVSKYLKVVASLYYSLAHIISQLKEDESHNNMIICLIIVNFGRICLMLRYLKIIFDMTYVIK
ncbi:E3 ubiquitin-protein ligase listerin-like [Rhizophagus irregularis DAOM 181602=DAOM 197198]|nr:E3 ubiquitin-protein ligase listerin-like [Rhizophagus irregularis DAOM 181602=DAOM 197198]